jgi:hypothetical protein
MEKNRLINQIKRTKEKMEVKMCKKKRKIMIEKLIKKEVNQEKRNKNKSKKKLIKRRMIRDKKEEVQPQDVELTVQTLGLALQNAQISTGQQ